MKQFNCISLLVLLFFSRLDAEQFQVLLFHMDFALEVFELVLFELKERGLTNSINDPGISPYYYLKSLHKLCNLRVAIVFCSSAQSFSFHKISSCAKGTT